MATPPTPLETHMGFRCRNSFRSATPLTQDFHNPPSLSSSYNIDSKIINLLLKAMINLKLWRVRYARNFCRSITQTLIPARPSSIIDCALSSWITMNLNHSKYPLISFWEALVQTSWESFSKQLVSLSVFATQLISIQSINPVAVYLTWRSQRTILLFLKIVLSARLQLQSQLIS